jgi:CRISPR/Cas system-associated endonuclease Cas1
MELKERIQKLQQQLTTSNSREENREIAQQIINLKLQN